MCNDDFGRQRPPAFKPEESESLLDGDFGDRETQISRLQTFRAGSLLLGILEDEIATIAQWRQPTPLPHAPPAVLGVVSIQGRMLTVLDPSKLLDETTNQNGPSQGFIVALRGEEQLALAIDDQAGALEIPASSLERPTGTGSRAVYRVVRHRDRAVNVIEVKELFSIAMRGRERRQRRF
jgi:chemotaxis signal transduction protein